MRVNDRIKEILLALGIAISPTTLNAEFNIFNPATWGEYTPGSIANQAFGQDTSGVDSTSVASAKPSGGNIGSLIGVDQSRIDEGIKKAREEWEKTVEKIEKEKKKGQPQNQEIKKADMGAVNAKISALMITVPPEVLKIVLPAWSLSPGTKNSLMLRYGSGLTDYQYKQLLFWDEYNYAIIKAEEICAQLGISKADTTEFALAYATLATLGYGIGRWNMNMAVNIGTATMQAKVDPSQWSLPLALQYLPPGIYVDGIYVFLGYPKRVIAQVWKVYGIPYFDYGSGVSPVQAEKPSPGYSNQPPREKEQTQPPTTEEKKVQTALESVNSALSTIQRGKEIDYEKKVRYFDRTINYGEMLYAIKTKSSTIDVILLEASGAGLISYYQEGGVWKACLTPDAIRVLKDNYGYKDKGNFGKNIEELNKTLQEMADKRNESAENFDSGLAKALENAGRELVPQGNILVDALKDGGVEALQSQIANYRTLQSRNQAEIDSEYDQRIKQLLKLKGLVERYYSETDPAKKESILKEIGELEARRSVTVDPPVYKQLTGREYKSEEKGSGVPPADEVLEEQNVPGYQEPNIGKINGTESQSNYLGSYEIGVGAGEITPDSVGKIIFQPRGYDFPMTVDAYLGTLNVQEHPAYDKEGVEYQATALTPEEKAKVLENLVEDIQSGKIKKIDEETIKKAVKEATGLDVSLNTGELQDWKAAFSRGYRCDGTPKAMRRV